MKKGLFITIYGINNIGKSTHAKRLVERLKKLGKKAVYIKYPLYNLAPTGPFLNKMLRESAGTQKISEEELQLWFVLNRYQFQPELKKMLASGTIVVAEDYVGTGIAWGVAKGARLKELEMMNTFLVQSDCSILMDGKRSVHATERHHLHESNTRLIEKCQKVLRMLAKKYHWKKVQVAEDREVTAERLWGIILDHIKKYP